MYRYLTLNDVEILGRRVLVRSDLNTPLSGGQVADDFRIRKSLPAIRSLRSDGAIVVVCSHLGRPQGPDADMSLAPVAQRMEQLGGFPVRHLPQLVGGQTREAIDRGNPGDVFLLENTRFHPGETSNDETLTDELAELGDIFCQDAFGSVHRAHASTVGVAERIPSVAGPLLVAELTSLGRLLDDPPRPFVVILGGAKVSDKLGVLSSLIGQCEVLAIGGGMAFTALLAQGHRVGNSLVEEKLVSVIRDLLEGPLGKRMLLPEDVVAAEKFAEQAKHRTVPIEEIADHEFGLDIGPATASQIAAACSRAGSIFWNGPMGVFEWEAFGAGTGTVAQAVTSSDAFSVVGGGDSVAAIRRLGLAERVSHVSTGGGAGLRLLEGKPLPGVEVLKKWVG